MTLVRIAQSGRTMRLTLDDPGRQNALSADMVVAIEAALDAAPPDTGALVIEGAGTSSAPARTSRRSARRSRKSPCPARPIRSKR